MDFHSLATDMASAARISKRKRLKREMILGG